MRFTIFKQFLIGLSFVVATTANAGLITDTSNDSFIDNTTGLEWMDFGVNDIHSYNQVESLLTSTYLGWTIATQSQVIELFDNAFGAFNVTVTSSSRYTSYLNNDSTNKQMLQIFSAMGYGYDDSRGSLGWFEDELGGLSYAHFYRSATSDANSTQQRAQIYGKGVNFGSYRTNNHSYYSTMLVRSTNVPEPSTLAIFALGMIGLASRRFKKQS